MPGSTPTLNEHSVRSTSPKHSHEVRERSPQLSAMFDRLRVIVAGWNHPQIIELATESLDVAYAEEHHDSVVELLRVRALSYEKVHRIADAYRDLAEAETLALRTNFVLGLAKVYGVRATFKSNRGQYADALEMHMKCYDLKKHVNDPASFAYTIHEIAYTYARMRDLEKAIQFYKQCIEIRRELGDDWGCSTALHGLGLAYYYSSHFEQAVEYTEQSLAGKLRHPERENSIAMTQHSLASCHFHLANYDVALQYLQASIHIKEKHGDVGSLCLSYNLRAYLLDKLGDPAQALDYARRALDYAVEHDQMEPQRDMHDHLSRVYESLCDFPKSLYHMRQKQLIEAHLAAEEGRLRFEEVSAEVQLRAAQHKAEVEALRAEGLQVSIEAKHRELTAMALNVSRMNEMLNKLQRQISDMRLQGVEETVIVDTVERSLKSAQHTDLGWKNFEDRFRDSHQEFMAELLKRFPSLSPVELRVCVLLFLNLSSKEIATILSVTTKSIEVYRTRLRAKMKLPSDANLVTWLKTIQNEGR